MRNMAGSLRTCGWRNPAWRLCWNGLIPMPSFLPEKDNLCTGWPPGPGGVRSWSGLSSSMTSCESRLDIFLLKSARGRAHCTCWRKPTRVLRGWWALRPLPEFDVATDFRSSLVNFSCDTGREVGEACGSISWSSPRMLAGESFAPGSLLSWLSTGKTTHLAFGPFAEAWAGFSWLLAMFSSRVRWFWRISSCCAGGLCTSPPGRVFSSSSPFDGSESDERWPLLSLRNVGVC